MIQLMSFTYWINRTNRHRRKPCVSLTYCSWKRWFGANPSSYNNGREKSSLLRGIKLPDLERWSDKEGCKCRCLQASQDRHPRLSGFALQSLLSRGCAFWRKEWEVHSWTGTADGNFITCFQLSLTDKSKPLQPQACKPTELRLLWCQTSCWCYSKTNNPHANIC